MRKSIKVPRTLKQVTSSLVHQQRRGERSEQKLLHREGPEGLAEAGALRSQVRAANLSSLQPPGLHPQLLYNPFMPGAGPGPLLRRPLEGK